MAVLNKEKNISGCLIFKMNVVLMNTEKALRLWVVTKQKIRTEIIGCSLSGLVNRAITLQPFKVVIQNEAQEKSEVDFLSSSFSYI